jgi:hypothetical protein
MQAIQGFENVQAVHGRTGGALPGGTYPMVITSAKEDTTGYGNQSLRVAYDVVEGEYAGRYADIAGDPDQNWRHEVEIDVQEANGARLKALIDAVQASNAGYVWDWNEAGLVGKYVGLVLQERKTTLTRGKNKGQERTYLDFWDAVPYQAVVSGEVNVVPPVNDKRTAKNEDSQDVAPVAVPAGYAQQGAPVQPMQPIQAPQQPVQQAMPVQPQYMPQQQTIPVQPMYQQQPQPVPVGYQQQSMPMQPPAQDVYDEDVPF